MPDDIYAGWNAKDKGAEREAAWNDAVRKVYKLRIRISAAEFERRIDGELPADFGAHADAYVAQAAGRRPGRRLAQGLADGARCVRPAAAGTDRRLGRSGRFQPDDLERLEGRQRERCGKANYVYYGVREFGMTAISNGLALHGGFIPYDATFLVFSDYARNAVRMSALIPAHAIHVYTHDSIGLGEDGPTHQPIEHLASLRLHSEQPRLASVRCGRKRRSRGRPRSSAREGAVVPGVLAPESRAPAAQRCSRSRLIERGGYVLVRSGEREVRRDPDRDRLGSRSRDGGDARAAAARASLRASCRCRAPNVFDRQPLEYREGVLPAWCRKRVAVEAGVTDYWRKYVGLDGAVIGIDTFGASAPAEALFKYFGFTVEAVVDAAKRLR